VAITTTNLVQNLVFWVAAVTSVIGGIGVISARSSVYSALSLILTLAQLAILYVLLNAQFIAAAQILIYAGAVMVLFLFVITLLGVKSLPLLGEQLPFQRAGAILFSGLLLFGIIYFVAQSPQAITGLSGTFDKQLAMGNVQAFGTALFTTFVFPFEITALLLIVAMVGAVSLGRRSSPAVIPIVPSAQESPEEVRT
jgi:NADH-quinone oxidoreductase subunit J